MWIYFFLGFCSSTNSTTHLEVFLARTLLPSKGIDYKSTMLCQGEAAYTGYHAHTPHSRYFKHIYFWCGPFCSVKGVIMLNIKILFSIEAKVKRLGKEVISLTIRLRPDSFKTFVTSRVGVATETLHQSIPVCVKARSYYSDSVIRLRYYGDPSSLHSSPSGCRTRNAIHRPIDLICWLITM